MILFRYDLIDFILKMLVPGLGVLPNFAYKYDYFKVLDYELGSKQKN